MKITLKRLKVYPRLSEETTAFNADVYADGVLIAYAQNDGHGGETRIDAAKPELRAKVAEAEAWAKTLPPITSEVGALPMHFDFYIDMLVGVYETASHRKNKANGFVTWDIAQNAQHDASGVSVYPEFRLWNTHGKFVYYPTEQVV